MTMKIISLLALCTLTACTSDTDKARHLGFSSAEQMNYLINSGFKNYDEFKTAHPYSVQSDSKKFAEAGLGMNAKMLGVSKESDTGGYYEGPNGAWLQADDSGAVSMIGYSCIMNVKGKSKVDAAIDGIGCAIKPDQFAELTKGATSFCGYENYEQITVLVKNNAFFVIQNSDKKLEAMGFAKSPGHIIYNQSIYEPCAKVIARAKESKAAGFDSVYDMDEALKLGIKTGADWRREKIKKPLKEKYSRASNFLEKATVPLVSTRKDFQDFRDNGGLNVISNWRGYSIGAIEVEYTSGALTLLHMVVDTDVLNQKKPATFNNIKSDLINECGSEWKSRGRSDAYWADSNFSTCEISEARRGGYHVVVSIKAN